MKKRKILAVILSAAMIAGLSIGSYADETPEVNFDAVVEEYYQEGEEVTVPGRAPEGVSERIQFTEEELQEMKEYYEKNMPEISPYYYDNSWTRVTDTSLKPYKSIANLRLVYNDGSVEYGTGAAVADGVVLTAAHCIYNPISNKTLKSVQLRFGRDENSYENYATSTTFYTPPGWMTNKEYDWNNDYGIIIISPSVTKKTGLLSYSSVQLTTSDELTLTGYPYSTLSDEDNEKYNGLRCYTDTGRMTGFYDSKKLSFNHNMNCTTGDSGSPVYVDYGGDPVYGDDENWVIRGIHSGGYNSGTSKGVAKTIDSKVMNLIRTYEQ